jgi:hypothetical protein
MNCDCTEKISALIDGELPAGEARELQRHLLNCLECQEAQADFLNLRTQITDFPVSFQPLAQREALARILGKEGKEKTASGGFGWRWAFNPAVAAFASLLIVGVVFGLLVYPRLKSSQAPQSEIAINGEKRDPRVSSSPAPKASPEPDEQKNVTPKKSPAPTSSDKNKTPNRKSTPIFVPQPDNIAENVLQTQDSVEGTGTVRSADAETMTAIHLQKSELLLRSFRNVRVSQPGAVAEVGYEKKRAQQLVYQNMILRREADAAGDAQVASLLESLEPILLDIANLPDKPQQDDVRVIKDRVERKNIVALLQVNSTALARALD